MHRFAKVGLIVLAVFAPAEALFAQTGATYSAEHQSCLKAAGADADKQTACVKAETSRQGGALNAAYKRLMTRLNRHQRQLLKLSQRSWIRFREAECGLQSSILIGGPLGIQAAAQADAEADCLLHETHLRAKALKADFDRSWDGTT